MKCENCKYWTDKDSYDDWDIDQEKKDMGLRRCSKAMELFEATEWRDVNGDYRRAPKPQFEDQKFFVQDGSDYKAEMFTKPDFFCAHFEDSA